MPMCFDPKSRLSFKENRRLLLSDFLSPQKFQQLKQLIQITPQGGNFFLSNLEIKKFLLKKEWAWMVCDLIKEPKIIFGFDRLFKGPLHTAPCSLQQLSSVTPLALGVLVSLEGIGTNPVFPTEPNQALFFDPQLPLPWQEMTQDQKFLLFCYANMGALYIENTLDPFTYELKKLGYPPNAPLKQKTHPEYAAHR